MRVYYPGAEKACDSCPHQIQDEEKGVLYCAIFGRKTTRLHWNCMKEDE